MPGDKAVVRWRRPTPLESELTSYDVSTHEVDDEGTLLLPTGQPQWVTLTCTDLSAARPEQPVALQPLRRYVARVRAVGHAKDAAKTKLTVEWSPLSEPVVLARRMGGGFGLLQSAAAEEAMARAKRRSMDAVAAAAVKAKRQREDAQVRAKY